MNEQNWRRFFNIKSIIALLLAASVLLSAIGVIPVAEFMRQIRKTLSGATETTAPTGGETGSSDKEAQYRQALDEVSQQIKENSGRASLYTERAALYYQLKEYDNAIADYTTALGLQPDPETYYLRAIVYTVVDKDKSAYDDLTKALASDPRNKDYRSLMADTCNTLKRYDEARQHLEFLLSTDGTNAILYTLAGDACVYTKDYAAAAGHYKSAIKYYSVKTENNGITKASLYSALANSLKSAEKYTEAIEAYDQALKLADSKELYFQKGFCLLQSEQYEAAIEIFNKCIELDYEVAVSRFQRGLCYYILKQYQNAIDDFTAYEAAFPDKTDTYLYMGLCYQAQEKYDNAIVYFQKSISADISVGDCNFHIGNCYYNKGEFAKAIPYYTTAIDQKAQLYPALLNRGVAYVKLNKYNEAKVDLKRVIDECSDPDLVKKATTSYEPIKNITIITKK